MFRMAVCSTSHGLSDVGQPVTSMISPISHGSAGGANPSARASVWSSSTASWITANRRPILRKSGRRPSAHHHRAAATTTADLSKNSIGGLPSCVINQVGLEHLVR